MNIKGIVIRVTPFKEKSAMVTLLSKDKVLSFLAREIYKVNSSSILLTSPLIYGEFTFVDNAKRKSLIYKEMSPIIDTRIFMNDFNKLAIINFINELTLSLFNEDDLVSSYSLLIEILNQLDKKKPIEIMLSFLAISLKLTGYGLNVDSCVRGGGNKDIIAVNYNDGGFISRGKYNEESDIKYSITKCKILRYIFKMNIDNIKDLDFPSKEAKEVFNDLLIYTYNQTGIRIKSESLVNKIS